MITNELIVEELYDDGTIRSVRLSNSQMDGDFIVSYLDEWDEPRSGPFHFREARHKAAFEELFAAAVPRRLGEAFFARRGQELWFKVQWKGIEINENGLSFYALSLPPYFTLQGLEVKRLNGAEQIAFTTKKDHERNQLVVYIECDSQNLRRADFVLEGTLKKAP